jgi:hypothetical protein
VSEYRPDAPEAIEEIIRKALSPHPKQRYRSASAMAADLMMVIAIDGPIDLSAWVRDLCPARYALQRKLSELRDPTPASVGDLFAEMMGAGSRHDTQEGPRAPEETTDRPQAPSTVRIGISL